MRRWLLVAGIALGAGFVMGQGSLDPSGPPSPGMRTLEEIYTQAETAAHEAAVSDDPRTPITNLPYTISAAGNYYLTGNLSGTSAGITINANNVVLDLGGFTMSGDTTGDGITAGAYKNIEIRNGTVLYWNNGLQMISATHSRILNINAITNNGDGMQIGDDSLVQDCRVVGSSLTGINASSGRRCRIKDCMVKENGSSGISASYEAVVTGCQAERNGAGGIGVMDDGLVQNCTALNNGTGANIAGAGRARLVGNQVKYGAIGIVLSGSGGGGYVADNYVMGCVDNYSFTAGNQLELWISEIPETLDWPCVARLSGTLTMNQAGINGIVVNSDNVTIDLSGHGLVGPGVNAGAGILMTNEYRNFVVRNGTISRWGPGGSSAGLAAASTIAQVSRLQILSSGTGLLVGGLSLVEDCVAYSNQSGGILAGPASQVLRSAGHNGMVGIQAGEGSLIADCLAHNNWRDGIIAGDRSIVRNCNVYNNAYDGIRTYNGVQVEDCMATYNDKNGVLVNDNAVVKNCTVRNNGYRMENSALAGVHAKGTGNFIQGVVAIGNNIGLTLTNTGNIVVGNVMRNNGTNLVLALPDSGLGNLNGSFSGAGAWDNFDL